LYVATKTAVLLVILDHQGQAGTPGPNGSPSDSATFTLNITINSQVFGTVQETLTITGQGNTGGAPCQTRDDGSTSVPEHGTLTFSDGNQLPYTETSTDQCSGSYAGGHLNYVETTVNDERDFSGSSGTIRCPIDPHKKQVITGDFTSPNTISGTFSGDGFRLQNCTYKG
jgi:hypothetical protein